MTVVKLDDQFSDFVCALGYLLKSYVKINQKNSNIKIACYKQDT